MTHGTTALLGALDDARVVGNLPPAIDAIVTDSRAARPGALYVALRGERMDGHSFAGAAVANGAVVVVAEHEMPLDAPQVIVRDTRVAISRLADTFYEHPSHALEIAGITGTNGKTTTAHLVRGVLEAAGRPCGIIGTLGGGFAERAWPLGNTTPLALELHAVLAGMRSAGAAAVAMEVSSHALALGRVRDVRFAVAALTNVTRDHLDFHETLERYTAAKRALFDLAPIAVLNLDDAAGARFAAELPHAVTYAVDAAAAVRPSALALTPAGSIFRIDGTPVTLRLPGRFNVRNALAAFAVGRALGVDDAAIARGIESVDSVAGRMERIGAAGIDAVVDYAHTPDALANVLRAARETAAREIIVVFGCGGDRDPGKRPQMGAIAAELADRVIVTSDNPRSEDPFAIARAVADGIRADIILDRRNAIRTAVLEAQDGDTLIVAGKGHEPYQIIGSETRPFDDRDEVRAALAERAQRRTPA
ncbi:MAG: UDP-N-acetylmuramoyl-L-alanyl-D-glutamate--2,6-diaminopimelate ligase [Candidatus Velthaea sp.]